MKVSAGKSRTFRVAVTRYEAGKAVLGPDFEEYFDADDAKGALRAAVAMAHEDAVTQAAAFTKWAALESRRDDDGRDRQDN